MSGPQGSVSPQATLSIVVARAAAAVCALIGALVLVGWYAAIPLLLKLHPGFVAMQFNAALAFVVGGLGTIAVMRGRLALGQAAGVFIAALGAAVLVEYLAGADLGIDLLLWRLGVDRDAMDSYTVIRTSAPGRLAPNTALGFLFAGTVLGMIRSMRRSAVASLFGSILGLMTICIGLVGLLGYVGGAPSAYGWLNLTRMALHTAVAITALGVAVSALVAAQIGGSGSRFFDRLPWLVAAGGVVVSLGLWYATLESEHQRIDAEVTLAAKRLENQALLLIEARMQGLTRLGMRWNFSGRRAHDRWEHEASLNLGGAIGFEAIMWVDANRRVRWIVPAHGDLPAALPSIASMPTVHASMDSSRAQRTLVIASISGDAPRNTLLGIQPLYPLAGFDGHLIGLFSARPTFDAIVKQALLTDYEIAVFEGNRQIYASIPSGSPIATDWARDILLTNHGVSWRVRISPTANALRPVRTSAPTITPIVTVLLTVLLVWLIRLGQRARAQETAAAEARDRLRDAGLARERAAELAEINDQLRRQIAEREQAEAGQRFLHEQLMQSQKMEAIGKLAGGVAHDFNNLLTVISGYSDMLLAEFEPGEPRHADLTEIKAAAHRAASLTAQLLAFSRKQILQPRVIDLNEVVQGVDSMLRRLIGADVELVTSMSENLGLIKADPGQLEQVIVNLAVNARDAMPYGGRIMIETANAELSDDIGDRHIGASAGYYVSLTVSDTGSGMDRETIAKIFEPFFTTKEPGKGTGLGLSTVHGIVKQTGGDLWVYSEVGSGTAFKLYFPRLDSDNVLYRAPVSASQLVGGSESILIVEDDDALRELTRRILADIGYSVITARNGAEALAVCEGHDGDIDLLITDIVMPGMSGRILVEQLLADKPLMKTLYMSGYTDDDVFLRGDIETSVAFIQKPFTPEAFARKVRDVIDSSPRSLAGNA